MFRRILVLTAIVFQVLMPTVVLADIIADDEAASSYIPEFCNDRAVLQDPDWNRFCQNPTCTNFERADSKMSTRVIVDYSQLQGRGFDEFQDFCADQKQLGKDASLNTGASIQGLLSDGTFGTCVRMDEADLTACDPSDGAFKELQDQILRGELITILEEPISKEKVFNRARICQTNFIRDKKGNLQKIDDFGGNVDATTTLSGEYAISIGECRSYIVEKCVPRFNDVRSVPVANGQIQTAGGSLPLVVYCDKIQILAGTGGVDLIKTYVGLIYRWAAGFIGVVAVVVIVISGIQISAADGDSAKVDEAKTRITQSLVSIAVLFLSGIILYAINPTFFTSVDIQNQQADRAAEIDAANEQQSNNTTNE